MSPVDKVVNEKKSSTRLQYPCYRNGDYTCQQKSIKIRNKKNIGNRESARSQRTQVNRKTREIYLFF